MDRSLFELPDWYKALTLNERAAILRGAPFPILAGNEDLGERRLARWRSQEPFASDGFFARRLASDHLTEDELRALLSEPVEAVAEREASPPPWLTVLTKAFTHPAPHRFPEPVSATPSIGFLNAIRPLLDGAYSRLLAGLRAVKVRCPDAPFDTETTAPLLASSLPASVLLLMSRTMAVELQLARKEGRLTGDTPEERFQSFLQNLSEPAAALAVLRQYPVLSRALVETVERWEAVSLELMNRLATDWSDLLASFAPDADPGPLVDVQTGLGDCHRGGRTVSAFRFSSGLRLVYKPRSLRVEAAFQHLLEWMGSKGFEPALRPLRLLDRGDYGWIEFVEAGPCDSEAAVRRFYRREGGLLALLWLLDTTDLHWENMIAAGEHPFVVDLETLFQPPLADLGVVPDEERVGRVLQQTVLSTGLLPSRIWTQGGRVGVDLSGLAGAGGQLAPPMLRPENLGTDAMRYTPQPVEIPTENNLPVLAGERVTVHRYIDEVVCGFLHMARLLREHRQEMSAPWGPLDAFAGAEVRVIVRPTRNYALLFFDSFHPYVLGDALDRDRLLDRLWLAAPESRMIERLIPAERRDLLRGDIPMFTARPDARDVWGADGERFADLQPCSGLERVRRRLERLDEAEIARQAWLVHNSLAAIGLNNGAHASYDFREADPPSREDLVAAAVTIGKRLSAIALQGPRDAHWFAPQTLGATNDWTLRPAGLDLHLGLPGIALFLAFLGQVTGEACFTSLARATVVTLRDLIPHGREMLSTIGAYSGWGGLVWTLTQLGVLWGDEELLTEAKRIAHEEIPPLIPEDESNDLIAGASGCLISLLTLHHVLPSDQVVDAAIRCGERLLARALPMEQGLGWHLAVSGPTPLAGLSHGVAGIAWPLLRLAALTGERRFHETALRGLEYERSLYRPEHRNWPDLRVGANPAGATEPHLMWAWCHGAPGVGLGRLAGLPYLDDATVRAEIETAVESTIENGFGHNHCLCHGDLGNLEVVTLAADRLSRPDWAERAGRIAGGVLKGLRDHGPLFGIPGRTEPPGIMTGLAGIGYGLLRLAAPERVPSVLTLECPR